MGATAQLMSDFQMSRVSRSQYRLHCRGCHRSRPPRLRGESACASAPLGRALGQTQDAYNGGGAGIETVTVGVCTGAASSSQAPPLARQLVCSRI